MWLPASPHPILPLALPTFAPDMHDLISYEIDGAVGLLRVRFGIETSPDLLNAAMAYEAAHYFSVLAQRQGRYFGAFTSPEAAEKWLLARPRLPAVE